MVHHHGHRTDARIAQKLKRLDGLAGALPLVDQRGGEVFHAEPEGATAGFVNQPQVLLHLERVMHGDFGAPAHGAGKTLAPEFGTGQRLDDVERAGLAVEEVVIGAEEIFDAEFLVQLPHFVGDALAALEAMLPLVVCGNWAVIAREFAAEGQNQRADRAEPSDATGGKRLGAERRAPAGRFDKTVAEHGMRKFVEIADEALNACIDQFLGHAIALAARIDQAGNVIQCPGIAGAIERFAHRFV